MMVVSKFIYLCDKKKPCSNGFACREGLCKHTSDADHAKNGEIQSVSEADGRFDEVLLDEYTIHYVEREVEALRADSYRLIPVSERLPEPKKDVFVWTIQGNEPRFFVAALFPYKTDGYVWIGEEEIHLYPEQVLYWMPLPDPPVEVKE